MALFATSEPVPKVGKLPSELVYVTATTKYGEVRVGIVKRLWELSQQTSRSTQGSRDHIAIKIKQRLNSGGANVYWLKWDEISFGEVTYRAESEFVKFVSPVEAYDKLIAELVQDTIDMHDEALSNEEAAVAVELFPDFMGLTPPAPDFDPCGCFTRPVTAM